MLPIKQSINKINGSMHHQCIFCIPPAGEDPKRKCWNLTLKPPIHWCHHGRTKLQNLFANRHHLLLLFFTRCSNGESRKKTTLSQFVCCGNGYCTPHFMICIQPHDFLPQLRRRPQNTRKRGVCSFGTKKKKKKKNNL